ncbi:MAG: PSD1 and planctomycete cytochrome C domain-containing protein [Synoicihabitans sp.]
MEFNAHVRPILVQNCTACHGGVKTAGGVSFIYSEDVLSRSDSGKIVVTPGAPETSEMYRRITSTNELERMPPVAHGDPLEPREIAIIERWISDGATWEEHWAYEPEVLHPVEVPAQLAEWGKNEIDAYVLSAMHAHGLEPNAPEEKARLLRRLSLDLIGLPPTWAEVKAFEADHSAEAYEKQVDRLLARPEFGERWAAPWLDLARYADTKGFERDPGRDAWPWRDWVIDALNDDMPFDEFTRLQLAGDQKEDPSLSDLVATGFHRNTKTNVEGGSDDEEFRIAAVMDRVNTTWQAWMGTSFSCVQCHSHPYDPIPHESYYSFMSMFDNDWDHDMSNEYPTIGYALDPEEREAAFELQQQIAELGRAYQEPFRQLATQVEWAPVDFLAATSTRGVTFAIERDVDGSEILQTGPNVPKDVLHTVHATTEKRTLAALRIDALMAPDATVEKPGHPFVVSFIEGRVIPAEGDAMDISFARVIPDEFGHADWPEDSLDQASRNGWSAYPKQHYDRWAVLVPEDPVEIPVGAKLELLIHNRRHHDGAAQPVLRRFQVSVSEDDRWSELNEDQNTVRIAKARLAAVDQLSEIERAEQPVLRSRNAEYARVTNFFIRGDWRTRGDRVAPGVPPMFEPSNGSDVDSRARVADWLVSDENPLTSRFTVNRHWEQLFGRGLMETLEDFGSASPPPSHPELLDYLAIQFRDEWGWSVKRLLREMVMTATYRQSAVTSSAAAEIDPRNIWLSRGPRNRLSAEMIRDNALQVAGLLSDKMYGPPVMPVQPEGVWRSPYNNATWETSEGEDQYRRAIYTFWKRTVPYPSILTFDAPSRDVCVPRRIGTNTPLQALVMLNDPVYWEAAGVLAKTARAQGGADVSDWIKYSFQRALLRDPDDLELSDLVYLHDQLLAEDADAPALQLTMNAILNLDDFLTK